MPIKPKLLGWLRIIVGLGLVLALQPGWRAESAPSGGGGAEFADSGQTLAPLSASTVAWGDYDNDDDLDLLLTGFNGSTRATELYRNSGGAFTAVQSALAALATGDAAWGDYDNDGDLDLLLTGSNSAAVGVTTINRNDGAGVFTAIDTPLAGVRNGAADWGDYDHDGDLDVVLTGRDNTFSIISRVYRNEGSDVFTTTAAALTGVFTGSAEWLDFNGDSHLDLLLLGCTDSGCGTYATKLYQGDGSGGFGEVSAGLPQGLHAGEAVAGDYDNDGDPDLLITGFYLAEIYRNDGGGFTDLNAGLTPVGDADQAWGDYDNDGDLDILVVGSAAGNVDTAKLYRNDGGDVFTATNLALPGVRQGDVAWADYDQDGDLDFLVTGSAGANPLTRLYRNATAAANVIPSAPVNLAAVVMTATVTLSWQAGPDSATPANGLTYAVRVGLLTGSDVSAPPANLDTGCRRVAAFGAAGAGLNATLTSLAPGRYTWSVQAIDTALAGSAFAAPSSFIIAPYSPPPPPSGNLTFLPLLARDSLAGC